MTSPDDRPDPGQRRATEGAWNGEPRPRETVVLAADRADHRTDHRTDSRVDDNSDTVPVARHDRDGDGVDDRKQSRLGGMLGLRRKHHDSDRDGDGVPDRVDHHDDRADDRLDGYDGGRRDGLHDTAPTTIPVATAPPPDPDQRHDGPDPHAPAVDHRDRDRLGWNSGADLGLLIMRIVLGGVFMAHGAQKVFGWFGGSGLDGFAQELSGMGFRQADALAAVTGFTELVGGALLILGIFTPLAAAGLLGVAINAIWMKWNSGLFTQDGGFEFELTLAALAAGLTLTGAGRAALDNGRVWFRHPVVTGWLCLAIGVGAAILVRVLFLEA